MRSAAGPAVSKPRHSFQSQHVTSASHQTRELRPSGAYAHPYAVSMNKLVATAFFALIASCSTVPPGPVRRVEFVGHRGAPFDAPENTVASARMAWAQDADAIETDIHLTKDGQIIVSHDSTTRRVNGLNTAVKDLTLAELRTFDVGSRRGERFAGEKMPTLDELIATVPSGKRLFVEIKTGPEILPALGEVLARSHATESNVVLISFNYEALMQAHARWPNYKTLWLVGYSKPQGPEASSSLTIEQVIRKANAAGFSGLDLDANWPLRASDVREIKAAGLQVHVWTIDDPELASRWIDIGVDGITTNRAGQLRQQLAT
jgi:glycerophosphoryl diester phosphodiesterase